MEGVRIDADRRAAMHAGGLWQDQVLTDYLDVAVAASPKRVAITHRSSSTGAETRLTYLELAECVRRVASGLVRLGVAPGDVVAYQLPNCWQFSVLHLACVRIGAISNPLMPIFRQRELRFMLEFGEAKVLVVPDRFRDFDYPSMVADIRSDLPQLEQVLVIGGRDENSFESHCLIPSSEDADLQAAVYASRRPNADEVTQLLYTSGTTGQPKGVLHTGNTLLAAARSCIAHLNLTAEEVILMA
ncbi:MAG TPA: cyclohexanecarboxylate-CoA ligase, partial [Gammaproteobacteria bacterium]|nr:cyclohexanecarboxylate-CoA ligase [Gammaproteobacteria bacterium]